MGTKVQCKTYLPGLCSMSDLNNDRANTPWLLNHENKSTKRSQCTTFPEDGSYDRLKFSPRSLKERIGGICLNNPPYRNGEEQLYFKLNAGKIVFMSESFQLREEIRKVLSKGKAAGVLRLVFHDAGTFEIDEKIGGMNGSILFELDRPENKGLKKSLKILEKAKSQIDLVQSVLWADIIALAGAQAISLCGGPSIPIQLGRIESL